MVLDDCGMSFIINIGVWVVSLDCLNALITSKPDRKCGSRRLRSRTSANIEHVEGMIRMTCHIVIKAVLRFMLVAHDGHV